MFYRVVERLIDEYHVQDGAAWPCQIAVHVANLIHVHEVINGPDGFDQDRAVMLATVMVYSRMKKGGASC